jgi:hypothetical protein
MNKSEVSEVNDEPKLPAPQNALFKEIIITITLFVKIN